MNCGLLNLPMAIQSRFLKVEQQNIYMRCSVARISLSQICNCVALDCVAKAIPIDATYDADTA